MLSYHVAPLKGTDVDEPRNMAKSVTVEWRRLGRRRVEFRIDPWVQALPAPGLHRRHPFARGALRTSITRSWTRGNGQRAVGENLHLLLGFTTASAVAMIYNMRAMLILDDRYPQGAHAFVAVRVLRVPTRVSGSAHDLKYSLAYVVEGECVLRFDNEAGKGDHFHRSGVEEPYAFTSLEQLLADFWAAVDEWGT
jgi:hypothetical protein